MPLKFPSLSIGTSGFTIQNFYPATLPSSERLVYYASIFPTVEMNSTFYHIPRRKTIEHWQQSVPKDFLFAFKVFQGITHEESSQVNNELLAKWFEVFAPFASPAQKHLMLFQFPASFALNEKYFSDLLSLLPESFSYGFEFRHSSWFVPHIYRQVLEKHSTIVVSDSPLNKNAQPLWPKFDMPNAPFSYIRLHGKPKLYSSSYSTESLQKIADFIQKKVQTHQNVSVYFNNDAAGHSAENALKLMELTK